MLAKDPYLVREVERLTVACMTVFMEISAMENHRICKRPLSSSREPTMIRVCVCDVHPTHALILISPEIVAVYTKHASEQDPATVDLFWGSLQARQGESDHDNDWRGALRCISRPALGRRGRRHDSEASSTMDFLVVLRVCGD